MKIVTANRLSDGRVVYLAENSVWSADIAAARELDGETAQAALSDARQKIRDFADVYVIDAENVAPAGRTAFRETIRSAGPTVRPDLGKQAGSL